MKEIARYFDPHEAQIAAGFLRAQGLQVEVMDVHTLTARPELRMGLGGFRLMAPESDAYMAERILATTQRKPAHEPCPECGSTSVRRLRAWQLPVALMFLTFLTTLVPFAPATDKLRCADCRHTWKDTGDEPSDDV